MKKAIKSKKYLFVSVLLVVIFCITKIAIAQTDAPLNNNLELMQQGKIRTCLTASFVGNPPHGINPPIKTATYELKGSCQSPTGCTCVWNQGINIGAARMQGECSEFIGSGQYKGVSCKDLTGKIRDRCATCNHSKADAINSILSSLKPIIDRPCTIIENKLNSGVTGILPFGPVDIVVREDTALHTSSDFSAVGDLPSTSTGRGGEPTGIESDARSQQLAQIEFLKKQIETKPQDLEKKCTTISWDPYGRVFDAVSLEPISGTEVTLINALTNLPAVQQYNLNDDMTGDDGVFNIQVEKTGDYLMTVEPVTNSSFSSTATLSPNWSKIYSDIYYPGIIFTENYNVATHHDIPLQPISTPYTDAVANIISGTLKSRNFGDFIVYTGRETFPMAKICIKDEDTNKIVGRCVNANNVGNFSIAVDTNLVPEKKLLITASKVNLNNSNLYNKNQVVETINTGLVLTSNKPFYFEPILSYVEGYAYGADLQKIPNADVLVKLSINMQLVYQTKTDDQGFFKIATKNLPYVEYYLEFINPKTQEKITKSTSNFVLDNKLYLNSEKINLMQGTRQNQEIIDPKTGALNNIANNNIPMKDKQIMPITKNPFISIILMTAIILVLLVIITIGIILYVKKNSK